MYKNKKINETGGEDLSRVIGSGSFFYLATKYEEYALDVRRSINDVSLKM